MSHRRWDLPGRSYYAERVGMEPRPSTALAEQRRERGVRGLDPLPVLEDIEGCILVQQRDAPEGRLVRWLRCLVPKDPLRREVSGPAASQLQEVKPALGDAPFLALRCPL